MKTKNKTTTHFHCSSRKNAKRLLLQKASAVVFTSDRGNHIDRIMATGIPSGESPAAWQTKPWNPQGSSKVPNL